MDRRGYCLYRNPHALARAQTCTGPGYPGNPQSVWILVGEHLGACKRKVLLECAHIY